MAQCRADQLLERHVRSRSSHGGGDRSVGNGRFPAKPSERGPGLGAQDRRVELVYRAPVGADVRVRVRRVGLALSGVGAGVDVDVGHRSRHLGVPVLRAGGAIDIVRAGRWIWSRSAVPEMASVPR